MPSSHARLSASAAERWMHCPGSITLTERLQLPNTGSIYADEGTMAHSVAEWKVMHTESGPAYKKERGKWEASEFWCGEMDEATTFYANEVQDIYIRLLQQDAGTVRMVEQRIDLKEWIPGGFGTSDAVVIGAGEIHVVDLKYGKGVKVEAEGNPQLRLYGLGSASLFGDLYDFDTVVLHIIQPRLDHISTERIALKDLRDWGKNEVRPAADEAANGSERTACGDWCRFCPAKAVCRARAEENLELARMDFKKPMELTHDEIVEVLGQIDRLLSWAKDVTDYALAQALAGEKFRGWKLVEGRANRRYTDETKVAVTLKAAGFDEAMLYSKKLLTITDMEKLVGKKRFAELLEGDAGLVVKPTGKPVLVPASDKREELNTAQAAADDFGSLPF